MTVSELIEKLQGFNPDYDVQISASSHLRPLKSVWTMNEIVFIDDDDEE